MLKLIADSMSKISASIKFVLVVEPHSAASGLTCFANADLSSRWVTKLYIVVQSIFSPKSSKDLPVLQNKSYDIESS